MSKMTGYIFYSKQCKSCLDLITYMENQGILNMFEIKCVDTMSETEIIRLGLSGVPTIVIITTNNGRQQKGIYEKNEAFKWVNGLIQNKKQNMMKHVAEKRKLIEQSEMKKKLEDGVFEYCSTEAQGISDSYAYYKEDKYLNGDLSKDLDLSQPKSFLTCDRLNTDSILTIPENKNQPGYKLNERDQKVLLSKLENNRKDYDDKVKLLMEQEQIQKVLNPENPYFN